MAIGEHKNHMALEKDLKCQGVLNINTFFKSHYPINLDQDYGWLFLFFSQVVEALVPLSLQLISYF